MPGIQGEDSEYEFHPELQIRWDDETKYAQYYVATELIDERTLDEQSRIPRPIELSDAECRSVTASVIAVIPAYFALQSIFSIVIR